MPLDLQVKLLRVLETGTFMRVGSTQVQEADVRLIAATNRNPLQAVASGQAARRPDVPAERVPDPLAGAARAGR
jgi:transcriptional regulator with PAS, ATPase and Fis domain